MKKYYTIICVFTTCFIFSQTTKEIAQGIYLRETADGIEVVQGSKHAFNSPNDVVIIQDSYGNRYWTISDGTVVKYESTSEKKEVSNSIPATPLQPAKNKAPKREEAQTKIEKTNISEPLEKTNPNRDYLTTPVQKETIKEEVIKIKELENNTNVDDTKVIPQEKIKPSESFEDIKNIDVSDLFEERFDKLPKKERKERERNEKRIRQELERELKLYQKEKKKK